MVRLLLPVLEADSISVGSPKLLPFPSFPPSPRQLLTPSYQIMLCWYKGLFTLIKWLVTGPLHLLSQETDDLLVLFTIGHCVQHSVLQTTSHCTSHDSSEYMTGHAMLFQSVHCHIVDILISVRGLTVRSGACLQLSPCFALCTCHLPPSSKMSMLKTGNERISGYVLVHVGLSQPCHILIWATLYGKK